MVLWYYEHWDQFGTIGDNAVEIIIIFDIGGHRDQFSSTLDHAILLLLTFIIIINLFIYLLLYCICWLTQINSLQHLIMHVIRELLSYFDNDGHWNQFGTTLDHAIVYK